MLVLSDVLVMGRWCPCVLYDFSLDIAFSKKEITYLLDLNVFDLLREVSVLKQSEFWLL